MHSQASYFSHLLHSTISMKTSTLLSILPSTLHFTLLPTLLFLMSFTFTACVLIVVVLLLNCHLITVGQDIMIVKQEDQIEALSGILAQQMLEPNYKVREYVARTYVHTKLCLWTRKSCCNIAAYHHSLLLHIFIYLSPPNSLSSPLSSLLSPLSSLFSSPTPRLHSLTYTLTDTHTHTHQVMVFLPTARQTGYLAELFNSVGMEVMEIHSRKSQVGRILCSRNIW